ncbi:hypothetical protein Y032_0020g22 [Ancylostoma ceylanicum]|uniref:Uncharacterized protein n=1 Tax=Ancylostoma ceylanicum TaxID=53326 RepID=A0A016V0C5_9BILA|nr:hypothetical protein Y032_0020g22 [Ancylostoma ceylanicum]
MLAVTFIATPLRSGSPWQMHDVKGYLSAAVISAIVMVISFAICVKRRPKEGGDPTEMPRRDRVGANGSVVRNAPSGIKPVTAKEERTALPPSKNPKGEKTIPRSEPVAAAIAAEIAVKWRSIRIVPIIVIAYIAYSFWAHLQEVQTKRSGELRVKAMYSDDRYSSFPLS